MPRSSCGSNTARWGLGGMLRDPYPTILSDPVPQMDICSPQDTSDCYLELFPSHLYFQAHSSAGLTFQVRGLGKGGGKAPESSCSCYYLFSGRGCCRWWS